MANKDAAPIFIDNGTPSEDPGRLARRVLEYDRRMRELLPEAREADDWAPMAEFVDTDKFGRVGCFLERQDWDEYVRMLAQWSSATKGFDTKLLHVTECGNRVFYEIQETHTRGDGSGAVDIVNSMTAFTFDSSEKIVALRVYLQAPHPSGTR